MSFREKKLEKFLDLLSKILEKEKRRTIVGVVCALVVVSLFVKVKFGWGGRLGKDLVTREG